MIPTYVENELLKIVGRKHYKKDNETLLRYASDETSLYTIKPNAVIFPENAEQVSSVMKLLSEHKIPLISRGAGTNLCGGTVPVLGGIVMVLTRLNKIIDLDKENLTATVQAGVITKTLADYVTQFGFMYPPDPGSIATSTIGGNIASGAGGMRGFKYGTTKDYVLGLEAVLANGMVIHTGGKSMKDMAGYDLTKLLVGSEGTLAVITEATVRLIPTPSFKKTMVAAFSDLEHAAKTVSAIIRHPIVPATLEIMDKPTLDLANRFSNARYPKNSQAVLLIEQDGEKEVVDKEAEIITSICKANDAIQFETAQSTEEANQLMQARRNIFTYLKKIKSTVITEDVTVPKSQVVPLINRINEIAKTHKISICTFGHAGDGNLHPAVAADISNHQEIVTIENAFKDIFAAALKLGGTITGEHGVGIMKAPFLKDQLSETSLDLQRQIKHVFDPHDILNPGKIFISI